MEIEKLQNMGKELEKRKATFERKVLELYGLKEQQSYTAHLQKNLQDKNAEIDKLNITINALKVEIKDLQEKSRQDNLAKKQIVMAKKMIEEMQVKMDVNSRQVKGMSMLEEKLSGLKSSGTGISAKNALVEKKLRALKSIKLDVVSLRRRNKELELEKRELAVKLVAAQAKISAISKLTEGEIIARTEEEITMLRHANEDLLKEVERLQKNRFDMVEELLYQRRLNACLRFKMQDHQTPSRKTVKNELEKTSGQDPYQKTEQLISNPNNEGFSSLTLSTESKDIDSSTIESSSSSQRSMLSTAYVARLRRVSFNDAVVTVPSSNKDLAELAEGPLDEKEMYSDRSIHRSTMNARCQVEMPGEKPELSSPEVLTNSCQASNLSISTDKYIVDTKADAKNGTAQKEELHSGSSYVLSNEDKNDNHIECCKAAFYFFLFMLLVYFFSSSCRTY